MTTILGTAGNDTLIGTRFRDTITGKGGNDTLHGLGDADRIFGGPGDDVLFGYKGTDRLMGGAGNDRLKGGFGDDFLKGAGGEDDLAGGDGNDELDGGADNDKLNGGAGDDILFGDAGHDKLIGGTGDDKLDGGEGDDILCGGEGRDTMIGGDGDDRIKGGTGSDVLKGEDGADTLLGGSGDDRLNGGAGADDLMGGEGNDRLWGGADDDELDGSSGDDRLNGGAGEDDLMGGEGDDRLWGGFGDDELVGGSGDDSVEGGRGDDEAIYVVADNIGASDDYHGGRGIDTLTLKMTYADWLNPLVQADIAGYLQFLADHTDPGTGEADSELFYFTAFDLTASRFEGLRVIVDGVELDPADEPVTARDDTVSLGEDAGATGFGSVLDNDDVPDLVHSVHLVSGVSDGLLVFQTGVPAANTGEFSFDPDGAFDYLAEGETHDVSFVYEVVDADGDKEQATVVITVTGKNDDPVAVDDTGISDEDTVVSILATGVLANDTDPDATDLLTVVAFDAVSDLGATVLMNADGSFMYDPTTSATLQALAAGETTADTFTYGIDDGNGGTDTATVTWTVTGVNDAPEVAAIDAGTVSEDDPAVTIDLLAGQTDIDNGAVLTAESIVVTDDLGGAVAFTDNGDGTITIDPAQFDALNDGESRTLTVDYDVGDGMAATPNTATLDVEGVTDVVPPPAPVAELMLRAPADGEPVVDAVDDAVGDDMGMAEMVTLSAMIESVDEFVFM